jgi:hypothetical protein
MSDRRSRVFAVLALLAVVVCLLAAAVLFASRAYRAEFDRRSQAVVAAAGLQEGDLPYVDLEVESARFV